MYYDIEFRIVRVRLDNGTYICIATNLSEEFPLEEINKLYRMRWSVETSFRELKYTIAVNICKAYLKHGGNETETMLLIQKYLTPVTAASKFCPAATYI